MRLSTVVPHVNALFQEKTMSAGTWAVSFSGEKGTVSIGAEGITFKTRAGAAEDRAAVSPSDLASPETRVTFLFTGARTREGA